MTGELYINSKDAYTTWGLSLEDGAFASLMTPPPMKDAIANESRLEHGKRRINLLPRIQERDITLAVHIVAKNKADLLTKYAAFVAELTENEFVEITTCYQANVTYKCMYHSCTQFSQYLNGMAKFSLKFIEPNPFDR